MRTEKKLSITEKEYWQDVSNCPLDVWEACHERGYHNLRKKRKKLSDKNEAKQKIKDYDAWNILFKDFVNKIGLQPEFKEYILLVKRLVDVQHKYIMSEIEVDGIIIRDRKMLNEINRLKLEIGNYEKSGSKSESINAQLMRFLPMTKVKLSKKDLTVEEFFELRKQFITWQKM